MSTARKVASQGGLVSVPGAQAPSSLAVERLLRKLTPGVHSRLGRRIRAETGDGRLGVVWPESGGYALARLVGELEWMLVDPWGGALPLVGSAAQTQLGPALAEVEAWATALPPARRLTEDTFWVLVECTDMRLEYVDGRIFAMGYASPDHERLVANTIVIFDPITRRRGCDVYGSNLGVETGSLEVKWRNPDVTVVCGPADTITLGGKILVRNPGLVVEVVSASTEGNDRRTKVAEYTAMRSVNAYLILDGAGVGATLYRRTRAGWTEATLGPGATVDVFGDGEAIPIERFYERTSLV